MSRPLSGKVALVCGASSGIGAAAALAIAAAGAKVAISARREDRLNDLVRRIEAAGGEAVALPGNVVDETAATAMIEHTIRHFGRLDILINSAGMIQAGGIEDADLDAFRRVIELNLLAAVYTCKAAIKAMRPEGGDIINISSLAGRKTAPGANSYSASKHALNAMTDAMRQEVGQFNIRVCTLMPGATKTEIAENIHDPDFRVSLRAHVSKQGAVDPSSVGDTIVFILSLPREANISEISIRPTIDTTA